MARLLKAAVLCFFSWTAFAGPGGSIGNFYSSINGLDKGYFVKAPYPTSVKITSRLDEYTFGLQGFDLSVEAVPYNPDICRRENGSKTVCMQRRKGFVDVFIVFGDLKVYALTLHDRGVGESGLQTLANDLASKFIRNQ